MIFARSMAATTTGGRRLARLIRSQDLGQSDLWRITRELPVERISRESQPQAVDSRATVRMSSLPNVSAIACTEHFHPHSRRPLLEKTEPRGGSTRHVENWTATPPRPSHSVDHTDDDFPAVGEVGDAQPRAERIRSVCGHQFAAVV